MEHRYKDSSFGEEWFDYSDIYEDIVKKFPSGSKFVEVGCWKGRSTSFMAVEIANSNKKIDFYCVDTWESDPLYDMFINNMNGLEDYYIPMKTTSLEATSRFENESLDFVFLDASHKYQDVREDIINWLPKIKPHGILAGHDYDWSGVGKSVNELLNNFKIQGTSFIFEKPKGYKISGIKYSYS